MKDRRSEYDITNSINVSEVPDVLGHVLEIFDDIYSKYNRSTLKKAFEDCQKLFDGDHPDYLPCDTLYHDKQHTMDMTLALARLINGHDRSTAKTEHIGAERDGVGPVLAVRYIVGTVKRPGSGRFGTDIPNDRPGLCPRDCGQEQDSCQGRRFELHHVLSREDQGTDWLKGHIDSTKVAHYAESFFDPKTTSGYYICGPEAMISEVSRGLRGEGIAEENIHFELFAASAENARKAIERHHARAQEYKGMVSEVNILSDGRKYAFELSTDGENILDAGLRNGVDLPFSCKGGVCATCKARLIEGEVDMDLNQALRPDEIEKGYILTRQSHPISEKIVVDFD